MKWIKYKYVCNILNEGTENEEVILLDKKIGYNEKNLAIAQAEAYNGEYEIITDEAIDTEPLAVELGGTGAKSLENITVGKATQAMYASSDKSKGTIEKRFLEVPLVANYTIEPNTSYANLIKEGEVYADSFPVYCFNRRPRKDDIFTIQGLTQTDHIAFNLCAKMTGEFAWKDGVEYAQFTAEEIRPTTSLMPLMATRFTTNGGTDVLTLDEIDKGYTASWGFDNFNRVPIVGEKYQAFGEAKDGHFHYTAEITDINDYKIWFKVLDIDKVDYVKEAGSADKAKKDIEGNALYTAFIPQTADENGKYRLEMHRRYEVFSDVTDSIFNARLDVYQNGTYIDGDYDNFQIRGNGDNYFTIELLHHTVEYKDGRYWCVLGCLHNGEYKTLEIMTMATELPTSETVEYYIINASKVICINM